MRRETSTNFGENQRRSGNSCELRFCDIRDVPATTLMADVAQAAFPLGVGGPSRGREGARKPALTPKTEVCEEPEVRPSKHGSRSTARR